jgi:uncharacterized protein
MKDKILDTLSQIEKTHSVKILYACELGSRAWGYHNKNSDYDIRFIYIHHPHWYITLDPQRDFIELPISERLDVTGWDLQKCLKSYRKSNPTTLELIKSKVSYFQAYSTIEKLRFHAQEVFSAKACLYHYLHMAEKNYRKKNSASANKVKNYLNVLRPILVAGWIEKFNCFPEMELSKLVDEIAPSNEIKNAIDEVIAKKVNEYTRDLNVKILDRFVENELRRLFDFVKNIIVEKEDPTPMLNKIFLNTLTEVWGTKLF